MTVYERACETQSALCRVAESYYATMDEYPNSTWPMEVWQEAIDRAYVLGLMIDAMPVELAGREI